MYVNSSKFLAVKMLYMLLLHLSVILFVKSQLSFCSEVLFCTLGKVSRCYSDKRQFSLKFTEIFIFLEITFVVPLFPSMIHGSGLAGSEAEQPY